jgi:hypothetical protein
MQLHILNDAHDKFLRDELNMTLSDFKRLSFSEMDKIVDEKLMWIECDGDDQSKKLAAEIVDSIYGPYDLEQINGELDADSIKKAIAV